MSTQNIFTIERTTGVVTATQNPLLVYNDVIPISVAFTNSAVVDETLMPRRAALSVSLRLGSASGVIIAQAIQFSHAAGYASATLQLSPESQDRVYLSDGVVWLEFNLSEKTGPSSKHTIESEINTASAGGVADLVDAALTGTTSVQVLSPDIADLGTVASGTVTLSSAKAVNKVILSGSAATIVLPSTPPDGVRTLDAVLSGTGAVTVTVPAIRRLDIPGWSEVTSVVFEAGTVGREVSLMFKVRSGAYVGLLVIGDEPNIPSSALAGLSTDASFAGASADKFPAQTAVVGYIAGMFNALTLDYDKVRAVPENRILLGSPSTGTGAPIAAILGAGFQVTESAGVHTISTTNPGGGTPVIISGNDIDWAAGSVRYADLTTNRAFTVSNIANGNPVTVYLIAVGADRTPTWPANVDWGSQTAPTILSGESAIVDLQPFGGFVTASIRNNGFAFDTTAPLLSGNPVINVTGDELTITANENLAIGAGGNGGFVLSGGQTITYTSLTGAVLKYAISPPVPSGTVTLNYTNPSNTGVTDITGNALASFTGQAITNDSTVSTYLLSTDFEGTGAPSGWSSTGTVNWGDTTSPLVGTKSLSIAGASAGTATGTWAADQTTVEFFLHWQPGGQVTGTVIELLNNANAAQLRLEYRTNGWRTEHGTHIGGSGTGPTANRGVLWGRYVAESGGGGNGVIQLWWNDNSSSETKPGSTLVNATAGTGDAVRKIKISTPGASGGGTTYRVDKARVASTTIGSNPA